jgi:type IX secretion system PorP/SprF family membrane protein
MKKLISISLVSIILLSINSSANAQGLHFSQFFNTPMLLNPSNTGLLNDSDYRIGANYRNQNSTVPVPYNTYSGFADFTIQKKKRETNWLGVGVAAWSDDAGDANLKMTNLQASLAYHILTSDNTMWSIGSSAAYVNRRVNLDKLTFIEQWDEFSFNNDLPNKEQIAQGNINYMDINFGASFAYFNNEKNFVRISAGVQHINQPKETFLNGNTRLGIRPNLGIQGIFKTSENAIFEPSLYYASQKKASEIVGGGFYRLNLNRGGMYYNVNGDNHLLVGAFYRYKDALIPFLGYKYKDGTLSITYDVTMSRQSIANSRAGGLEISLIYNSAYDAARGRSNTYDCPRF